MRGDAAARQGDTLGVSRKLGHVGGTKSGGDENTGRGVRSSSSGVGGCAAAETSHVIGTQRERRISQVRQVRRDLVRGLAQGRIRRQARLEDQRLHPLDQGRVCGHELACLDDFSLAVPTLVPQTSRYLLQLMRGSLKRGVGAINFATARRRRDGGPSQRSRSIKHNRNAERDAWGGADSLHRTFHFSPRR
jgi:hypothetical protein